MDKRERTERAKQEDAILNKVLLWIVGAVVLEALLLLLNRYYVNYLAGEISMMVAIHQALPVLAAVFAAAFAVCVFWAVSFRKKEKGTGLPVAFAVISAALAVCCAVARLVPSGTGVRFLYVCVPVAAVLAMIYYLYQREFFIVSALSAAGLAGLWLLQRRGSHAAFVYACLIALGVVLVACVVLVWILQSSKGVFAFRGKSVQLLPRNTNYVMFYVTCGVVAAVLAAGIAVGAMMLLYAVLVAWLLIMAVYYTVKLM